MAPPSPSPAVAGHAPNLDTFLKTVKIDPTDASAERLIGLLQRRQITGPDACAVAVLNLYLQVIKKAKWTDANALLERIQRLGRRLIAARPQELSIGNITRRTMGLIRDEAAEERNDDDTASEQPPTSAATSPRPAFASPARSSPAHSSPVPSSSRPAIFRPPTLSSMGSFISSQNLLHLLQNDMTAESEPTNSGASTPLANNTHTASARDALRSELIDGLSEIKDEIGQAEDQIAAFAEMQIYPRETVMVFRPTPTVEKFLIKAATKRKFTVMIAGVDTPLRSGAVDCEWQDREPGPYRALRDRLAKLGTKTVLLAGGGIKQHMAVVTKVIIDARSILPGGGVVTANGAGLLARAAKGCKRTVMVLGAVYRIAPAEPPDLRALLETSDGVARLSGGRNLDDVDVRCPESEILGPEMIDLYVSNLGPNSRQHLQAIISDHYKKEDINFC